MSFLSSSPTSARLPSLWRIIRREQTAPLGNTGPLVAEQPHTDLMEWTSEASARTVSGLFLDLSPDKPQNTNTQTVVHLYTLHMQTHSTCGHVLEICSIVKKLATVSIKQLQTDACTPSSHMERKSNVVAKLVGLTAITVHVSCILLFCHRR